MCSYILSFAGILRRIMGSNSRLWNLQDIFSAMVLHTHTRSAVYYTQTNGSIERVNKNFRKLSDTLKTLTSLQQSLNGCLLYYNNTIHDSTNATPSELLFKFSSNAQNLMWLFLQLMFLLSYAETMRTLWGFATTASECCSFSGQRLGAETTRPDTTHRFKVRSSFHFYAQWRLQSQRSAIETDRAPSAWRNWFCSNSGCYACSSSSLPSLGTKAGATQWLGSVMHVIYVIMFLRRGEIVLSYVYSLFV